MTSSLIHISVMDPPETERNAAPENPARNLVTIIVAMFFATAVGICHTILLVLYLRSNSNTYEKKIRNDIYRFPSIKFRHWSKKY